MHLILLYYRYVLYLQRQDQNAVQRSKLCTLSTISTCITYQANQPPLTIHQITMKKNHSPYEVDVGKFPSLSKLITAEQPNESLNLKAL